MPYYTLILHDNSKTVVLAESKAELLEEIKKSYSTDLQTQIKEVHWEDRTLHFVEDFRTGEIRRDISTADVNPFGYRK